MRGTLSDNAQRVMQWFGVSDQPAPDFTGARIHEISPGQIMLITGASGAGKSTLLRAMRENASGRWIDLAHIALSRRRIVDCFAAMDLKEILANLGRVGLAEAWTYVKYPNEL